LCRQPGRQLPQVEVRFDGVGEAIESRFPALVRASKSASAGGLPRSSSAASAGGESNRPWQ
jgi:hypothetical protein